MGSILLYLLQISNKVVNKLKHVISSRQSNTKALGNCKTGIIFSDVLRYTYVLFLFMI